MSRKFTFLVLGALALFGIVLFFRVGSFGTDVLWQISKGGTFFLPLLTVSALIDSINPCALSILILTIAFLLNVGQLRKKILLIGGVYILGIFVVYISIGLGILKALHIFNTPHFMSLVGASFLILFGAINLINEFFPSFPIKLRIPQASHRAMAVLMNKVSVPAAFALGVLVGLCEFPCTGGPYLMVLGLLHDRGTYVSGFGYLVLYNLIFILPLAVILMIASERTFLEKVESWKRERMRQMRLYGGIAMVVLGLIIFLL